MIGAKIITGNPNPKMKATTMDHNNNGPLYVIAAITLKIFAWISSATLHEAFSYFASAGAGIAGFMGGIHYLIIILEKRKSKKSKNKFYGGN
jgi:hypothetical protein